MIRRIVEVPSTWEGWAMRVLTICTVLVLAASIMVFRQVSDVMNFMTESRADRTTYQIEQQRRMCYLLASSNVSPEKLREVQCSSR